MPPAHVRDTNRLRSCPGDATLAPPAGRAEAAAAIWDWRPATGAQGDAAGEASRKRLRGVVQALVTAAVGAVLFFFSLRVPAFLAFGLAGVVGFSALVAPTSLFAAIERAFLGLGRWTGWLLGWVLLVPVFYLFFAPFGRLLRRGRRDRLQRRFDREAPARARHALHQLPLATIASSASQRSSGTGSSARSALGRGRFSARSSA